MAERIFELLREYFHQHGYWTLGLALLLENAGVPVPGETVLLFASFLAFSERELRLGWIILVATLACTVGDNLGYVIGRRGGRPLLERYKHLLHVPARHIRRGERLFGRFGAATIFFARFVFGMRVIAGPLAGVLHMPWRQFAVFNLLGAATWVTVISTVGYLFGRHWHTLMRTLKEVDVSVLIAVAVLVLLLWWRQRRRTADNDEEQSGERGAGS